jgi:hypothetical protein
MIDRRTVMKSGAMLSAAALVPGLSASALGVLGDATVERFVFDRRFAESIEAGRWFRAQGTPVSGVHGDLTVLWYTDLSLRWKERPMALAGLTAEDALFVLGTLAPAYRMRVVKTTDWGIARSITPDTLGAVPLYAWIIAER